MKVTTSKSKNAESFYISKSFINDKGVSTSVNVHKLGLHKVCRKIRDKYSFKFDINSILSDLIYSRILEPSGKRSSYSCSMGFLEPPSYQLHDVYRSLNVLGKECDLIQSETYRNSHLAGKRNDKLLFYDCTNYYFEIEDEDGIKRYGKSKEHRPNPIIQMNKPLLNHLKKKF